MNTKTKKRLSMTNYNHIPDLKIILMKWQKKQSLVLKLYPFCFMSIIKKNSWEGEN